jgi:hypothetical protein
LNKKETYADLGKKIKKKYNTEKGGDREGDAAAQRAMEQELEAAFAKQEQQKADEIAKHQAKIQELGGAPQMGQDPMAQGQMPGAPQMPPSMAGMPQQMAQAMGYGGRTQLQHGGSHNNSVSGFQPGAWNTSPANAFNQGYLQDTDSGLVWMPGPLPQPTTTGTGAGTGAGAGAATATGAGNNQQVTPQTVTPQTVKPKPKPKAVAPVTSKYPRYSTKLTPQQIANIEGLGFQSYMTGDLQKYAGLTQDNIAGNDVLNWVKNNPQKFAAFRKQNQQQLQNAAQASGSTAAVPDLSKLSAADRTLPLQHQYAIARILNGQGKPSNSRGSIDFTGWQQRDIDIYQKLLKGGDWKGAQAVEDAVNAGKSGTSTSGTDGSGDGNNLGYDPVADAERVKQRRLMTALGHGLNSAGDIMNIVEGIRGAEDIGLDRVELERLNMQRARNEAYKEAAKNRYITGERTRNAGVSGGYDLSAKIVADAQNMENLGSQLTKTWQAEEMANNQIANQEAATNLAIANKELELQMQADMKAKEALNAGLSGLGTNVATGLKDERMAMAQDDYNRQLLNALRTNNFNYEALGNLYGPLLMQYAKNQGNNPTG